MAGKVYLIPNVIADDTVNEVISPQVRDVASQIDYFLVENIRTARRYLSSLKIGKPIESLHFEVVDKKTSDHEIETLFQPVLSKGINIGVISESGCPGVADPGAKIVALAHKKNCDVIPLVGPSSLLLALMASGFNGQSFAFQGYVSIKTKERQADLKKLENLSKNNRQTQIFIETPYRNDGLLKDILKACSPDTKLCIAKDVSGKNQFLKTATIKEWRKQVPVLGKFPTVFLIDA
ncbi:SAM-dependent methyltransferase [Aureibacter tunicatorum]|uniref:16S rRNA (Cytidine1402-2'-O)-methyltransferase n=1 Tax=Aureibacter tunicatorum TaxID=866807 RepID=A0AAE4BQX7_9BACT|nr:SAM-dependent methyltransferase [Aureibacter tunicatorum]MDR6238061.1 16S rRNA (cytidine1402-2'-O)-methyltransferase [Aureibacter tunicatorum]BDD03094.1 S-adenosylmethionine-dependent methyltransferase [Aureibacter tunicatorum]